MGQNDSIEVGPGDLKLIYSGNDGKLAQYSNGRNSVSHLRIALYLYLSFTLYIIMILIILLKANIDVDQSYSYYVGATDELQVIMPSRLLSQS